MITAFADKSFTFIMKTPPATVLIMKAAKVERATASRTPRRWASSPCAGRGDRQTERDLTAADLDAAVRTIAGSARSMGITVEGVK